MLNTDEFRIIDHNNFSPSTKGLFESPYYPLNKGSFKCVNNPTKTDYKETGIYKPRLTATKRVNDSGFPIQLRIEFSIPKLLHGNNFVEVAQDDFEQIIDILLERLSIMGVHTEKQCLINSSISAVHYSKNIVLEEYMTSSMVINVIKKAKMNNNLDLNYTDFRNGGIAIKYHANSFEIAIYDKMQDMKQAKKSEKRATENDNYLQMNFFDEVLKKKHIEVIRLEMRLNTRKKIKEVFEKNNIQTELTFVKLFKEDISKVVIKYYWNMIAKDTIIQIDSDKKPEDFFIDIAINNPDLDVNNILKMMGILYLINSIGQNGFELLLAGRCSLRTIQRYRKELKDLKLEKGTQNFIISYITKEIQRFIRVVDIDLLNNRKGNA